MNKEKNNTKKHILEISLDLFSKRGYSSVSIRDICSKVGIKESTVYYHFKNKQEIFDDLCKAFTDVTYAIPQKFAVEMSKATRVNEEDFLFVCQSFINNYLMDDKVNKFIRMLIIEQSTNAQAAELYHRILFDEALEKQKVIFQWLVQLRFLKDIDIERMVMDYYAPIIYFFHRYLVVEKITDEISFEVNQKLIKHVQNFLSKYKE
jgi:AcrR family transcriptional regulator